MRDEATMDEMNMAMNQLDQVTQENAAMAEETNAATQNLASGIAEELRWLHGVIRSLDEGTAR